MNKFDIIVTDINGFEHRYYIETLKKKKDVMDDINEAWRKNTGIQINYIEDGKESICIYDNKRVLSIDIKEAMELNELIKKMKDTKAVFLPPKPEKLKNIRVSDTGKRMKD